MNTIEMLYNWSVDFLGSASTLTTILNTKTINGLTILGLVSIGGILTYLGVALIKWLVS